MKEITADPTKQEVEEFIERSIEVVRHNDAEAMEITFSDDYDLVVPSGEIMSKRQLIDIYHSGDMKQIALNVTHLRVLLYGSVAVARGLYRSEFQYKGQRIEQAFLRTDVLAKSAGRWHFVSSHTTQSR